MTADLSNLAQTEIILKNANLLLTVILHVAGFIFLTVWGWIILLALFIISIIYNAKIRQDDVTFSGVMGSLWDAAFKFYTNITVIIIGLAILLTMSIISNAMNSFEKTISLYRRVLTLSAALKNLRSDRKLLDVSVSPAVFSNGQAMNVRLQYFAYSPVKDTDISSGDAAYIVPGRKLFVNFGVYNFDYSLLENGSSKNIAFPSKLYSDTVSFDSGIDVETESAGVPMTFKLDSPDIYILDKTDYNDEMARIAASATNSEIARELGLRTAYGESISIVPPLTGTSRIYSFYSTAAGGIIVK